MQHVFAFFHRKEIVCISMTNFSILFIDKSFKRKSYLNLIDTLCTSVLCTISMERRVTAVTFVIIVYKFFLFPK